MTDKILSARFVRTRVPHVCEWCAGHITIGGKAYYNAVMREGRFEGHYYHPECDDARDALKNPEVGHGLYRRGTTIFVG